jgi:hypothetical protein
LPEGILEEQFGKSKAAQALKEQVMAEREIVPMTIESAEFLAAYDAYAMRQFELNVRAKQQEAAFRGLNEPLPGMNEGELLAWTKKWVDDTRSRNAAYLGELATEAAERQKMADIEHTKMRNSPRQAQAMDAGDAAFRGNSVVKHEAGYSSALEKLTRKALEHPELLSKPEVRAGVAEFLRVHGQPVNYGATLGTFRAAMQRYDASRPRQRVQPSDTPIKKRDKGQAERIAQMDETHPDYQPTGPMGQLKSDLTAELNFNDWERMGLLQELYSLEEASRTARGGIMRKKHRVSALGEQIEAAEGAAIAASSEQGSIGASGRFYTPGEAQMLRMMVEDLIGVETLIVPLEQMTPRVVKSAYGDVVGYGANIGVKVGDIPATAQRYATTKFGVALERMHQQIARAEKAGMGTRHPLRDVRTMTEAGFVKKNAQTDPAYPRDTGAIDQVMRRKDPDRTTASDWKAASKIEQAVYDQTRTPWGKRIDRYWDQKEGRAQAKARKESMRDELRGFEIVEGVRRQQEVYQKRMGFFQREEGNVQITGGEVAAYESWTAKNKAQRFHELMENRSPTLEQYKQTAADSGYENFAAMLKDANRELLFRFADELQVPTRSNMTVGQLRNRILAADRKLLPQLTWAERQKIDKAFVTPEKTYAISNKVAQSYMMEAIETGVFPEEPVVPHGQKKYVPMKELERQQRSLGKGDDRATRLARQKIETEMVRTRKIDEFIDTREGNYASRQNPQILESVDLEMAVKLAKGKQYKALKVQQRQKARSDVQDKAARAELKKELQEAAKARTVLRNRRIAEKRVFTQARNVYLAKRAKAAAEGRYMEDIRRAGEEGRGVVSGPETAALRLERAILAGERPSGIPERVLQDFGLEPEARGLVGRPIERRGKLGKQRGATNFGLIEAAYDKLSRIFKKAEAKYGNEGPPPGKYARREKDGHHNWQTAREFLGGAQAKTPLVRKWGDLLKRNPEATALGRLIAAFDILPKWQFTRAIGRQQSFYVLRNKIRGMLVTGTQWEGSLARALEEHGAHWFVSARNWIPEKLAGTRAGLTKEKNLELVRGLMGVGPETPIVKAVRASMDNAWAYMGRAGVNLPPYVKNYFPYKLKRALSWENQNKLIDKVIHHSKKSGRRVDPENVASQIRGMAGEDGWMRMNVRMRDPKTFAKEQWNMEKVRKVLDVIPPEEMIPFLETDAAHVLTNYLRDASDRIAYGIKFGPKEQKLKLMVREAEKEMNKSGMGFSPEDMQLIDDLLNITQRTYRMPISEKWVSMQRFGIALGNWAKLGMVVPGSMVEALIPLTNRTMARQWIPALAHQMFDYPLRGLARQIYRAPPSKKTGFGTLGYDAVVAEIAGKVVSVDQMDLLTATHAADIGSKWSNAAFLANGLHLMTNVFQSALQRTFRMSMERAMLREAEIRTGRRKRSAAHDEDMLMFEYYGVKPENAMRWLQGGAKLDSAFFIRDYVPSMINFMQENVMTARGVNQPKWHSNPNWAFLRHLKTYVTMFGNTVAYGAYKQALGKTFIESPKHAALRGRNVMQVAGTFVGMYYLAMASEQLMDWWKYGGTKNHPLMERLDGSKEQRTNAMAVRAINRWAIGGFPAALMFDMWESGLYTGRGFADEDDIRELMSGTVGKDGIRALVAVFAAFHGLMPGDGEGLTAQEVAALIVGQMPMGTALPRNSQSPAADLMPTKSEIQEWVTDELQDMGLE